jgi:hypothetical protein
MTNKPSAQHSDPASYNYDKSTYVVMPSLRRDASTGRVVVASSPKK